MFQSGGVNGNAYHVLGQPFPRIGQLRKIYNSQGGLFCRGWGTYDPREQRQFTVGWEIHVPDYPNVSFQFADGNNTSTVFGTECESNFHSKMFGVVVSDTLAGFNFNGGYHHNTAHSLIPQFLRGEGSADVGQVSQCLRHQRWDTNCPCTGRFRLRPAGRTVDTKPAVDKFSGTIDSLSSGVEFQPITNLNLGVNAQYTNNLEGSLYQPLITEGGVAPAELFSYSTKSLDINSQANYVLPKQHLNFVASADHRQQTTFGIALSANTFNEIATYGDYVLGGFFNVTAGLTQTEVNVTNGSRSQGFFGTVSYARRIDRWNLTGAVNYSRNTQTVLIGYTSSGYGYSAGIGRKLGMYSYWSVNVVGTKMDFNNVSGSGTYSQSYSTSLALKRFSFSGSYSKSDGTSYSNPVRPDAGDEPCASCLCRPSFLAANRFPSERRLSHTRARALGKLREHKEQHRRPDSVMSENSTAQLNTMLQYKVRKLWITGGYLKLQQGFSISGQPPASYSSFFVGITRWFKFF